MDVAGRESRQSAVRIENLACVGRHKAEIHSHCLRVSAHRRPWSHGFRTRPTRDRDTPDGDRLDTEKSTDSSCSFARDKTGPTKVLLGEDLLEPLSLDDGKQSRSHQFGRQHVGSYGP